MTKLNHNDQFEIKTANQVLGSITLKSTFFNNFYRVKRLISKNLHGNIKNVIK